MKNKGFTLIELLVVVAIIGILAAIAIPQFTVYRQRGYDSRAETDLRNFVTAQEAYFASNEQYTSGITPPGFKQSSDVTITVALTGTSAFTATGTSGKGSGKTYTFDSTTGRITS